MAVLGGRDQFVIKDADCGTYFYMGEQEHFLLTQFDGRRSRGDLCSEFERRFHDPLPDSDLQELVELAQRRGFRAFTPTTTQADPTKQPASNTLDRDFTAEAPNRKWVTDITYLPTIQGWAYLAVVLDLFSRKVVGWAVSDSLATPLVSEALRQAIESRRPVGSELLHHSDRGCQYTSDAYQQTLRTLGIECSMSRAGECYDNAVAERFFWSLKHEWTGHESYENLQAARLSVFKYVETFYNSVRLHQTLGYKSPNQFEAEYAPAIAA